MTLTLGGERGGEGSKRFQMEPFRWVLILQGNMASRLPSTTREQALYCPLRDSRKVLWWFIMQIITQNAVKDPKFPLRYRASLSSRRLMSPCRSPADTLIVHCCLLSPCLHHALLTQSCPRKAVLMCATWMCLLFSVSRKALWKYKLLRHGDIKLPEMWLEMCHG